jgi:hypothetical protein
MNISASRWSYHSLSSFFIDQNTGVISVKSGLDRETLANYKLVIRASDQGTPVLSSSKVVPIKILDVNDNPPIFTKLLYSGEIAEDAAVGSLVVQVRLFILQYNNCDITFLTIFILTHPVNFPCGRKPEHPEKTHNFRQSVD